MDHLSQRDVAGASLKPVLFEGHLNPLFRRRLPLGKLETFYGHSRRPTGNMLGSEIHFEFPFDVHRLQKSREERRPGFAQIRFQWPIGWTGPCPMDRTQCSCNRVGMFGVADLGADQPLRRLIGLLRESIGVWC